MDSTLILPALASESLSRLSPDDFASLLYDRALAVANDIYDPDAYCKVELESEVRRSRVIFYLRRRAWAEWYFGTVTPARQISLLPDKEVHLKMRLARQISDEVRHHDVFSGHVRRLGGETDLARFPVPAAALAMYSAQLTSSSSAELAAANQLSGEIVLSVQARPDGNILRSILDAAIIKDIEDIESDEPAHIAIGRDLVRTAAVDVTVRWSLVRAQQQFLDALMKQHSNEICELGERRLRPLPTWGTV